MMPTTRKPAARLVLWLNPPGIASRTIMPSPDRCQFANAEYAIRVPWMNHTGINHMNVTGTAVVRSMTDGAIHRTIAVVDSQLPAPQMMLPGMARRWKPKRAAPA